MAAEGRWQPQTVPANVRGQKSKIGKHRAIILAHLPKKAKFTSWLKGMKNVQSAIICGAAHNIDI